MLDTLTHTHPDDPEVWFLEGVAFRRLGESRRALECLQQAHPLEPAHPSGITPTSFTQTGDIGEVGSPLKRVVTIHGTRAAN